MPRIPSLLLALLLLVPWSWTAATPTYARAPAAKHAVGPAKNAKGAGKSAKGPGKNAAGHGKNAKGAGKYAAGHGKNAARDGKNAARDGKNAARDGKNAARDGKNAAHDGKNAARDEKNAAGHRKNAKGDGKNAEGSGKNAEGHGKREKAQADDDGAPKTSAKDKKKLAALAKTCAQPREKKSARCKAYFADLKEREAAAERAALKKTCAQGRNKKSKQCKAFLAAERKRGGGTVGACGRKYGIARKNEKVAAFARRFRIAEGRLRDWNDLGAVKKLKGGKRYLVFKSPHDGVTLQGGVLLEAESDAFALQRPFRGWGKPLLVEALRLAVHQVLASAPEGTTLVIGDLSKEGGGCLAPHRSHRGGLDADVGFFYRGGQQRRWLGVATPETLDADRTWLLIKALLATGRLQMAFLDYGLQPALYEAALRAGETPQTLEPIFQYPRPIERAHETVIRHLGGHDNHMHVRLVCSDPQECPLPEDARHRMTAVRMDQRGGPVAESLPHERRLPEPARTPRLTRTGAVPALMR